MPRLRTLLVLGRASNLPTVWSNCLAGWWLGGHGNARNLPFLDRQHRKERPIPSGAISFSTVCKLGLLWLALGVSCLFWIGLDTGVLGVLLAVGILIYDAVHKVITFSPLLMGICRFLVYLVAASTAIPNGTGWPIWCGLALAAYIAGLSFIARRESARGPVEYWPLILLAAPIVLASFLNTGEFRKSAAWLSVLLCLWMLRCLRMALWPGERQIGRAVAGLLAGIVFVDWLAVADAPRGISAIFPALFGLAILFQQLIPAT
jgi:4-hydroxybenzoate polyprenyltransferase